MATRTIAAILTLAFCAGCSGEPAGKADPTIVIGGDAGADAATDTGGEELVVTAGAVTIAASTALEASSAGGSGPDSGNIFVIVPVSVANGLDDAIPVGYPLFRLRTDALERLPSEASANIEVACPIDALLSGGTVLQCAVVFEIPADATPTALIFQAPTETVESPVALQACTRCGGGCVSIETSESHCGACNVEVPFGGSCEGGEPTCPAGRFVCDGSCQRDTSECFLNSTRQVSCTVICNAEGLRCNQVEYYYQCTENTSDSHPDLGCDDQPPRTWDACGTYTDMDCRCLP